MKTPCLKCGLIHEEPTAICDGYVGLDPDETASDSRKQAAARIRAILAAVPIETRPGGRGKRRAEPSSTVAEMKPPSERAAERFAPTPSDASGQEVPEWRREVSERLETYRQRREKQSRAGANGQSVLAFRVHSKKGAGATDDPADAALPSEEPAALILDSRLEESMARVEAAAEVRSQQFESGSAAHLQQQEDAVPRALAAAAGAGAAAGRGVISTLAGERVYAPAEVRSRESDSEPFEAPPREFEELAYPTAEKEPEPFLPEASAVSSAAEAEDAEAAPEDAALTGQEMFSEPVEALPLSAEPAVVLADHTTLEVHADAMEAEEAVAIAPVTAQAAPGFEPAIAIPPIDTEYWRTAPGMEPAHGFDLDGEECGSLTSAVDARAAEEESFAPAADAAAAAPTAPETLEIEESGEPLREAMAAATEPSPELAAEEEPAYAAMAGIVGSSETLFAEPSTEEEAEDEFDPRREALRRASRRAAAASPERIEISVPQPVFDFSEAHSLAEHPQDQHLPVADLRERRTAGAIDATVLALTIGAFFLAFHLAGGEVAVSRVGAAVVLAASFLIYAQYFLLFTLTAGATPGMMLRGLRVVCFDGSSPGPLELGWRAFGCLLSAAAGMLGFLWAAWDEDGLTWHDRISQTYITYAQAEIEPLHAPVS